MLSFITAFLFGAGQVLLLGKLLSAVKVGDKKGTFGLFLLKLFIYIVAIAALVFIFPDAIFNSIFGFVAAVPFTGILLFAYSIFFKNR